MVIKEIIVVEGKSDTIAINVAVRADTIETNGSAVNQTIIETIRHAQQRRGVIIFTDPDFPGEKIRKTIGEQVPGCKHAFLTRKEALGGPGRSLGIEHASPEVIRCALVKVYTEAIDTEELISMRQLRENGLIGGNFARERREQLGEKLKIGYTNAKQLYKRLKMFRVTETEFHDALMKVVIQEENNEQ